MRKVLIAAVLILIPAAFVWMILSGIDDAAQVGEEF